MERLLVTGLWCAHQDPLQRPSVAQAVDVLRSEGAELPVLGTMGGSGEIHALEEQAYGDLSADFDDSDETAYLTTEDPDVGCVNRAIARWLGYGLMHLRPLKFESLYSQFSVAHVITSK
jgi:hypothetical protein